jgi:hypothetical protein
MLTSQEEQEERRRVALQDADLRRQQQQAGTFFSHAQSAANDTAGGRFAATGSPRVVGSTPTPSTQYPAASSTHQTELPPEKPLGVDINAMPGLENPTGVSPVTSPVAPGGAAAPSCPSGVEPAPPSSSEQDESNG